MSFMSSRLSQMLRASSLRAATAPCVVPRMPVRSFMATALRADSQPPTLLGSGAKDGTVPTEDNQATGIERFEWLGRTQGIDVFDMEPLDASRLGTGEDPINVKSMVRRREGEGTACSPRSIQSAASAALASRPTRTRRSGSRSRRTTARAARAVAKVCAYLARATR